MLCNAASFSPNIATNFFSLGRWRAGQGRTTPGNLTRHAKFPGSPTSFFLKIKILFMPLMTTMIAVGRGLVTIAVFQYTATALRRSYKEGPRKRRV